MAQERLMGIRLVGSDVIVVGGHPEGLALCCPRNFGCNDEVLEDAGMAVKGTRLCSHISFYYLIFPPRWVISTDAQPTRDGPVKHGLQITSGSEGGSEEAVSLKELLFRSLPKSLVSSFVGIRMHTHRAA